MVLDQLKNKITKELDENELDPINKDFFNQFSALINFLEPTRILEGKEIKELMRFINDSCFNNIQKYNLNEKPIKIENIKDESIKEYVKGMKLNIKNYKTYDSYYLDSIKTSKSLINDIFIAVKLVNLSVIFLIFFLLDSIKNSILKFKVFLIYILFILLL